MIEYKIGENKRVRLLTDLVDRSYPALDLASLYHRRWECELSYYSRNSSSGAKILVPVPVPVPDPLPRLGCGRSPR